MRYSKEHKAQTRSRIVNNASVALRKNGAHGIGVADLMKNAGLTHGGFYGHFRSRDALVAEAFSHAMDQTTAHWRSRAASTPAPQRLETIVNAYLSPHHRDDPANGCAMAALVAEMAREGPKAHKIFAAKLEAMVDVIAGQMSGRTDEAARPAAIAAVATMIGALVLARGAGTGKLSNEILQTGRDAVLRGKSRSHPAAGRRRQRPHERPAP